MLLQTAKFLLRKNNMHNEIQTELPGFSAKLSPKQCIWARHQNILLQWELIQKRYPEIFPPDSFFIRESDSLRSARHYYQGVLSVKARHQLSEKDLLDVFIIAGYMVEAIISHTPVTFCSKEYVGDETLFQYYCNELLAFEMGIAFIACHYEIPDNEFDFKDDEKRELFFSFFSYLKNHKPSGDHLAVTFRFMILGKYPKKKK